jgi:hypothetical protein
MSTHFANASISARPAAECVRASSAAAAPPDSLAAAFAFAAVDGRGCAARMIEHRQNRRCELLNHPLLHVNRSLINESTWKNDLP